MSISGSQRYWLAFPRARQIDKISYLEGLNEIANSYGDSLTTTAVKFWILRGFAIPTYCRGIGLLGVAYLYE